MNAPNLVVLGFFTSPVEWLERLVGAGLFILLVLGVIRARSQQTEKSLGLLIIACGAIGVVFAFFFMETSSNGITVNLGLMDDRRNVLDLSALAVLGGIVLYGFGIVAEGRSGVGKEPAGPRCPKCNGVLEGTPELCKHCRNELRWNEGRAFTVEQAAALSPLWEERRREQTEQRNLRQRAWREAGRKWRDRWKSVCDVVASLFAAVCRIWKIVREFPRTVNQTLKRVAGDGNDMLYRFYVCVALLLATVAAVCMTKVLSSLLAAAVDTWLPLPLLLVALCGVTMLLIGAVLANKLSKPSQLPSRPPPLPSRPPPLPSKPPPLPQSNVVPAQDGDSAPRPPSDN